MARENEYFVSDKNGAEVEFHPDFNEYVCLDCGTLVDDETGHYRDECNEAARDRAEDMQYDQWRE